MVASPAAAYNQVPYETCPAAHTHPDRLATIAALYGMEAPPPECCRVLELGCGNGENLIPMAPALPGSHFVGVDIASVPVAAARSQAAALGLSNIEFLQADLMDLDASFGQFDYIVAHGVYSWVPDTVRGRLLEICGANLTPNGVAFVSYNTYPGCHLRNIVRDMMLYQTAGVADPESKLEQARALVDFLASAEPASAALRDELRTVQQRERWAVYHDDLAEEYRPVYFHEFAEHARRHGLQFLAEAHFYASQEGAFAPAVAETIRRMAAGDRVRKQQYIDFLKCRRFRRTLLCHERIHLPDEPSARAVTRLRAATAAQAVGTLPDVRSSAEEEFRSPDGASMKTALPLAKAAMWILGNCWPASLAFDDLLAQTRALLSEEKAGDADLLSSILLRTYASGLLELNTMAPRFTTLVSERPRAFLLARLGAERGPLVTTLRHSQADIEDRTARRLIALLDGTRDHAALLRDLQASPEAAGLPRPIAPEDLDRNLAKLARMGVLEA